MTIADKLIQIAQKQQKIHEVAYEQGKAEGGGGGTNTSSVYIGSTEPSNDLGEVGDIYIIRSGG